MSSNELTKRVLNVGGGSKKIPLPTPFAGFECLLLDIDPTTQPDVLCDARAITSLQVGQFDAIHCSHNLEHYYRHDVRLVLAGFLHVLKPGGFAYIAVPDISEVLKTAVDQKLELDDALYQSGLGPISVLDVLYGHGDNIELRGVDFFAHKTGFSKKTLNSALYRAGFSIVYDKTENWEATAIAFKGRPDAENLSLFHLPPPPTPAGGSTSA